MNSFLFLWFWLPLSLTLIGLISFIVTKMMHKNKSANVSLCFILWMTLSFLFPYVAKKKGIIKKWWLAIILMLVSPAAIATYYIVATSFFGISPYRYEELKFTDRESIELLTELKNFPEYEYIDNSYDSWYGTHHVRYAFKEELSSDFYNIIESFRKEKENENVFWSIDSLTSDDDKQFFGSDIIYVYKRGWDGIYISAPSHDMPRNIDVYLYIGKKGFVCKYTENTIITLDSFGNRDSISTLTGIQFPSYKSIDSHFTPCGPDWAEDWVIELDKNPNSEFIQKIKMSPNWKVLENSSGCYEFRKEEPMKSETTIIVDKNSKIVKACYQTM